MICMPFSADAAAGSLCAINEFACSVRGPCIPLAFLCNGEGNCPNGEDETRCGKYLNIALKLFVTLSLDVRVLFGASLLSPLFNGLASGSCGV